MVRPGMSQRDGGLDPQQAKLVAEYEKIERETGQQTSQEGVGATGPILAALLVAYVGYKLFRRSQRKGRKAAYDAALAEVAASKGDSAKKVAALEAGRRYYGGLRQDGAPTIYDEQAINNDINARSGG